MADTKAKVALLKELHKQQEALYEEKNIRYDDAFAKTYAEYGPTVALVRLEDKLNRAKSLVKAGLDDANGESLVDTLTDMANYANMFLIELAGPQDFPGPEKKTRKRNRRKTKPEAEENTEESPEASPLDNLTKDELGRVLKELGVTPPKKGNRKKLYTLINKFSLTDIAMAITAVKGSGDEDHEEETESDE